MSPERRVEPRDGHDDRRGPVLGSDGAEAPVDGLAALLPLTDRGSRPAGRTGGPGGAVGGDVRAVPGAGVGGRSVPGRAPTGPAPNDPAPSLFAPNRPAPNHPAPLGYGTGGLDVAGPAPSGPAPTGAGALFDPPVDVSDRGIGPDPVAVAARHGRGRESDSGRYSAVRPYVLTRGRTRAGLQLSLETLVAGRAAEVPYALPFDEAAVLELCQDGTRSIAELAALHGVPIGVAKVLVADLAEAGLLTVYQSFAASGSDLALLERVLGGLRRL